MTEKRSNRQYPREFKEEAVALITDQGYSVLKAACPVQITKLRCHWQLAQPFAVRFPSVILARNSPRYHSSFEHMATL